MKLAQVGKMGSLMQKIGDIGYGTKGGPTTAETVAGQLINAIITVLGTVMLFYLIYGGYLWMTAQGDESRVKTARGVLRQAIIGMIIIAAAFTISTFVLSKLGAISSGAGDASQGQNSGPVYDPQSPGSQNLPPNVVPIY